MSITGQNWEGSTKCTPVARKPWKRVAQVTHAFVLLAGSAHWYCREQTFGVTVYSDVATGSHPHLLDVDRGLTHHYKRFVIQIFSIFRKCNIQLFVHLHRWHRYVLHTHTHTGLRWQPVPPTSERRLLKSLPKLELPALTQKLNTSPFLAMV